MTLKYSLILSQISYYFNYIKNTIGRKRSVYELNMHSFKVISEFSH